MSKRLSAASLGLCVALAAAAPVFAANADSPAARANRWRDLEKSVFNGAAPAPSHGLVTLDAPYRAQDAALVPMTVKLADPSKVKEFWLIIDDNPSPVAAHFIFGPAADPQVIRLRVRINDYTYVHAVAALAGGALVQDVKFVKASGGCSAPMGESAEEAIRNIGEMRLKIAGAVRPGVPVEAKLMVRHPNFNGMQMNQVTRLYTPARFIDRISVKDGGKKVFDLETGISLSSNPVMSFGLIPQASGPVTVDVSDSQNGHWRKSFNILRMTD